MRVMQNVRIETACRPDGLVRHPAAESLHAMRAAPGQARRGAAAAVFIDPSEAPPSYRGASVVIGNFDGVHLGHLALIRRSIDRSRIVGRPVVALTFEPHPREFFGKAPLFRLTSAEEKIRLLAEAGVDAVVVMTFDGALASIAPQDFVSSVIDARLRARHVVVGWNFHFGRDRAGSPTFLHSACSELGIRTDIIQPVGHSSAFSSSSIRASLGEGRIRDANAMLGRSWRAVATRCELRDGPWPDTFQMELTLRAGVEIAPGRYDLRIAVGRLKCHVFGDVLMRSGKTLVRAHMPAALLAADWTAPAVEFLAQVRRDELAADRPGREMLAL